MTKDTLYRLKPLQNSLKIFLQQFFFHDFLEQKLDCIEENFILFCMKILFSASQAYGNPRNHLCELIAYKKLLVAFSLIGEDSTHFI